MLTTTRASKMLGKLFVSKRIALANLVLAASASIGSSGKPTMYTGVDFRRGLVMLHAPDSRGVIVCENPSRIYI